MAQPQAIQRTAPVERRLEAVQAALEAQGLAVAQGVDELSHKAQEEWVPRNGGRVVAKAWVDPGVPPAAAGRRPQRGGRAGPVDAQAPPPPGGAGEHGHGAERHLLHAVLVHRLHHHRPAPDWYKDLEYRARVVRESRTVLREMGLDLPPEVEIRVWDTTADTRYMVLPQQPAHTIGWPEDKLAAIVTRDAMIGVAKL
jgi:nitrile hydratase